MQPWSWPSAWRRALEHGADAWIFPYWTWAWAGLWWWLVRSVRPPIVAVAHNVADHGAGPLRRLVARSILGRCDAVFTHAAVLEREIARVSAPMLTSSHPLPPPTIGTLPERHEAREILGIPHDRRVALFFGIIRPYKGLDLLLEAVARLPEECDWLFLVAGEAWGDLGALLQRRARDLDIEDRVRLQLGWVPESDVPRLLAAADLVVLPYRSGSQSAVAPLALAAGLPVLSTDVGGLPEVVRHGTNGLLVAPGSADELVTAFQGLTEDHLDALADGARKSRSMLTWDGYVEALEKLLKRVKN
jgi:glycosyltransferase involved in cell wall biosynthesis